MKTKIKQITKEQEKKFVDIFSHTYFDTKQETKKYFKSHLKTKTLYVLYFNEEPIGFFAYQHQYSHYANILDEIYILKQYRRKGYSKLLLDKYIELSNKEKTKNNIALSSTHTKNVISQKMHEQYGFKRIGVLKKLHYGTDEIFYAYELKKTN